MAVFGLYVLPAHRGAGHARRAIQTAYTAVAAEKIWGLRLETDWCWQPAVRFYCAIGLWVDLWKDGLVFVRGRGLPPWRLELDGDRAHFVVDRAAGPLVLFRARREGARLVWEAAAALKRSASMDEMVMSAPNTFAVALALRGWPLHRSDGPWLAQRARSSSEFIDPEGLASHIQRVEAWANKHGWRVDTPRIPGLGYPTWDELLVLWGPPMG
jgi:hypothetical protein